MLLINIQLKLSQLNLNISNISNIINNFIIKIDFCLLDKYIK